ncbi:MAG: hypothetical protein ACFFCS_13185 [Candidatus Hodarchaeota archaeon]
MVIFSVFFIIILSLNSINISNAETTPYAETPSPFIPSSVSDSGANSWLENDKRTVTTLSSIQNDDSSYYDITNNNFYWFLWWKVYSKPTTTITVQFGTQVNIDQVKIYFRFDLTSSGYIQAWEDDTQIFYTTRSSWMNSWKSIDINFDSPRTVSSVTFRVHSTSKHRIRVDYINLVRNEVHPSLTLDGPENEVKVMDDISTLQYDYSAESSYGDVWIEKKYEVYPYEGGGTFSSDPIQEIDISANPKDYFASWDDPITFPDNLYRYRFYVQDIYRSSTLCRYFLKDTKASKIEFYNQEDEIFSVTFENILKSSGISYPVLPIKIQSISPRAPEMASTLALLGHDGIDPVNSEFNLEPGFNVETCLNPSIPDVYKIEITLSNQTGEIYGYKIIYHDDLSELEDTIGENKYSPEAKFFTSLATDEVECYLGLGTLWNNVDYEGEVFITVTITDFAMNLASNTLIVKKQLDAGRIYVEIKQGLEAGINPMFHEFKFCSGTNRIYNMSYQLIAFKNTVDPLDPSPFEISYQGPELDLTGFEINEWQTLTNFIDQTIWSDFIKTCITATRKLINISISFNYTLPSYEQVVFIPFGEDFSFFNRSITYTDEPANPLTASLKIEGSMSEVGSAYLIPDNSTPTFELYTSTNSETILDLGYDIQYENDLEEIGSLTGLEFINFDNSLITINKIKNKYFTKSVYADISTEGVPGYLYSPKGILYEFNDSNLVQEIDIKTLSFNFSKSLFAQDGSYTVTFWVKDSANYYFLSDPIKIYRDTKEPTLNESNILNLRDIHYNETGRDSNNNEFTINFTVSDENIVFCGFNISNMSGGPPVVNYSLNFDDYTNFKEIDWSYADIMGNLTFDNSIFRLKYFVQDIAGNHITSPEVILYDDSGDPQVMDGDWVYIDDPANPPRYSFISPEFEFTIRELSDFKVTYRFTDYMNPSNAYEPITREVEFEDGTIIQAGTGLREFMLTFKIDQNDWDEVKDSNELNLTITIEDYLGHSNFTEKTIRKDTTKPNITGGFRIDNDTQRIEFETLYFEYFNEYNDNFMIELEITELNFNLTREGERIDMIRLSLLNQPGTTFNTKLSWNVTELGNDELPGNFECFTLTIEIDDDNFEACWNDTTLDHAFQLDLRLVDVLGNYLDYDLVIARDRNQPAIVGDVDGDITHVFNGRAEDGYMRFGNNIPYYNFTVVEPNIQNFTFKLSYGENDLWFLQKNWSRFEQKPGSLHLEGYLDPINATEVLNNLPQSKFGEFWNSIEKFDNGEVYYLKMEFQITDHASHSKKWVVMTEMKWDLIDPVVELNENMHTDEIFGHIPPSYRFLVEDDNIKSVQVQVQANGKVFILPLESDARSGNISTFLSTYNQTFWNQVPHGIHFFKIYVMDHAGNNFSAPYIITKDLQGPIVLIEYPNDGDEFKTPPSYKITINDLSLIQEVYLKVNGRNFLPIEIPTSRNQLTIVDSIPVSVWDALSNPNNQFLISFHAIDKLGNEGNSTVLVVRNPGPLTHEERGDVIDLGLFLYMPRPAMYICLAILAVNVLHIYYKKKIRKMPITEVKQIVPKEIDLTPNAVVESVEGGETE